MTQITASMVKELRETTGAGMMDAKNALTENKGDMQAAIDWLRTKGLAKAAKKSGRTAAEGLVAVAVQGNKGSVIELNSETDFVSRNEEFQQFVKKVAQAALDVKDIDALNNAKVDGKPVATALTDLIAKIGENMTLRRMKTIEVSKGAVIAYVHSALGENLGKIGVLVALESSAPADKLQAVGKQIAMHIAAANPECLNIADIDPAILKREREVLTDKHREGGKPEDRIAQIVEGDLKKNFYGQICLMEQVFVIDSKTRMADMVAAAGKEAGGDIKITGFARFQLGEGIEKEVEDFAAEVAKTAKSA